MTGARPVCIGVTGPIGCGKSTIVGWLAELDDVEAIDADLVARDVLAPGTPEIDAVVRRFGSSVRRPDGSLDRSALGQVVFADPAALADLEAIVHPAVRPRIHAAIADAGTRRRRAVIVEAIKLVDGGLADLCNEIWLVTCEPDVQRRRLVGRGSDPVDAEARIAAQGDLTARLRPRATRVIDSGGSLEATRDQVVAALEAALRAVSPRA